MKTIDIISNLTPAEIMLLNDCVNTTEWRVVASKNKDDKQTLVFRTQDLLSAMRFARSCGLYCYIELVIV